MFCFVLIVPTQAKDLPQAPDFTLKDTKENLISLSSYKDKSAVLLFFWATWCPFCRDELKELNSRYAELTRDKVEIIGVNLGESQAKVEKFIRSYVLAFPMLLDRENSTAYTYNIVGVPTLVLVDKKGNIVFQGHKFPQEYKKLLSD